MAKETFLGKVAHKVVDSRWTVVPKTTRSLNDKMLSQVISIKVHKSDFKDKGYYAVILYSKGSDRYTVPFTLDLTCKVTEGYLDPASFKVFKRKSPEGTVIERCYGKPLEKIEEDEDAPF